MAAPFFIERRTVAAARFPRNRRSASSFCRSSDILLGVADGFIVCLPVCLVLRQSIHNFYLLNDKNNKFYLPETAAQNGSRSRSQQGSSKIARRASPVFPGLQRRTST
ncbi:hypothetical protein ACIQUG_31650 [Ensifer sp. NPDC090286]|uniref:hypothetical protein n=1 Tax=Ensifer sp. NPDC090286 TaxID=3363991 RepID=UPI00383B1406